MNDPEKLYRQSLCQYQDVLAHTRFYNLDSIYQLNMEYYNSLKERALFPKEPKPTDVAFCWSERKWSHHIGCVVPRILHWTDNVNEDFAAWFSFGNFQLVTAIYVPKTITHIQLRAGGVILASWQRQIKHRSIEKLLEEEREHIYKTPTNTEPLCSHHQGPFIIRGGKRYDRVVLVKPWLNTLACGAMGARLWTNEATHFYIEHITPRTEKDIIDLVSPIGRILMGSGLEKDHYLLNANCMLARLHVS